MSKLQSLLSEYGESHQNRTNVIIHKVFVPLIMLSVIGILFAVPTPSFMEKLNLNWALVAVALTLLYYARLSMKYFLFMIPILGIMYWIVAASADNLNILIASVVVFIISWAFQFIGHKIEGKKPSFLKDLLFLLIGPLWVAKSLFRLN